MSNQYCHLVRLLQDILTSNIYFNNAFAFFINRKFSRCPGRTRSIPGTSGGGSRGSTTPELRTLCLSVRYDGRWGGRAPASSLGTGPIIPGGSAQSEPISSGDIAVVSGGDSRSAVTQGTLGFSVGAGGRLGGVGLPALKSAVIRGTKGDRERFRLTFDDTPVALDAVVVIVYEQNAS